MHFSNIWGNTDLTNAIIKEDWTSVIAICEHHPSSARVWTRRVGFFDGEHESHVLPLHQACALYAPKNAVEAIVRAYPEGVRAIETSFKRTACHIACQSGAGAEVVTVLLHFYPEAAQLKDTLGRLPIHYACSNGASLEVIEAILGAYPWSAAGQDIHGWLPLHVACHFGASTAVVEALVNAYPDSIQARTEKGSTALTLVRKINCKNKAEIVHVLEDEAWRHWHGPMRDHPSHYRKAEETGLHHRRRGSAPAAA